MNSSTSPAPDVVATTPSNHSAKPVVAVKPATPKTAASPRKPVSKSASKPSAKTASKAVAKTAAKPAAKPVTKSATKTASKTSTKSSTQTAIQKAIKLPSKPTHKSLVKSADIASPAQAKTAVEQKAKKPKLIRDSFTFPKDEYQAIATLKQRALNLQHGTKKSEILRAGLKLMSSLNDKAFLAALTSVPALKTGRPAKS